MPADFDSPQTLDDDGDDQPREALRMAAAPLDVLGLEEDDTAEGIDLPGADHSGLELEVAVVPVQPDEFTCASCFLIRHHSQKAREPDGLIYCKDCEVGA